MSSRKANEDSDPTPSQSEPYLSGGGETSQPQSSDTNGRGLPRGANGEGSKELALPPEFRLVRSLGRGGMGVVYLVKRDTGFGEEELALKTILPEHLGNQSAIERFVKEVETLKGLRHDHIVPLRDFRKYQGYFYFLMEYIAGSTLDIYLRDRSPLSVSEALKWFTPLAEAVDYAHRKGVVHRDIKPSNVMLGSTGSPYLLDFGIARQADSAHTQARRLGAGTWEYMAPEQFDDDRPTRAMDVYSFGATLYFALVGRAPFSAVGIRSLLKEKEAGCPALEIAGLERPAVEALRSSLDVEAANRPDSCSELLNMLQSNPSGLSAVKPASIPFRDNLKNKQVSQSESRSTLGTRVEPTTSAVDEKKSDKDSRPIPAPKSSKTKFDFSVANGMELFDLDSSTESLEDSSAMKIETTSSDANTVSRDEASGHGWFRWLLKKFASSPPELNPKNEGVVQPSSIANSSLLTETRTNSIGMQFRLIRPGTFLMGSPESENGRHEDEMQHQVTLTRPFFLGLYPVTQEEYRRVMGGNPKDFKGNRHPMKAMNWKDAIKFIEGLNRLKSEKSSGRVYRLPTEAEWEYACRAGTATAYCFGNSKSELDKYAWYKKNSAAVGTRPVGEKLPNAWGLFDMHGNVLEWCSDWYGKYPHGAVTDPVGPSSGSRRVFRGGCYSFDAEFCRSAYRNWYDPAIRNDNFGFRLALEEKEEDTIYLALEGE